VSGDEDTGCTLRRTGTGAPVALSAPSAIFRAYPPGYGARADVQASAGIGGAQIIRTRQPEQSVARTCSAISVSPLRAWVGSRLGRGGTNLTPLIV